MKYLHGNITKINMSASRKQRTQNDKKGSFQMPILKATRVATTNTRNIRISGPRKDDVI
jgi:hypothetical protein